MYHSKIIFTQSPFLELPVKTNLTCTRKMVKLNKKSKRQTTRLRAKIEKKVREHKRKQKRDSKKHPTKKRKDPGVPNSLPFKENILKEAEDRKRQLEEERQKQKERRKKEKQKMLDKKRGLDGMVKDALKRANDFEKKQNSKGPSDQMKSKKVESSLKTFYKEFRKVVDAADVVLEVLDARDPLGSRCQQMEEAVIGAGTNKRLVLILNKIDLVPKENVEAWLKYLKNQYPVIAFKASTQTQNENLGRKKLEFQKANEDLIKTSSCLGADTLMKLLGNYCRSKDIKTVIRVGVVGLPNTGKSSIINSLKRGKACSVGATPGITKQMQEVQLDKHIRLLDSPGVVMATDKSDTSVILRNCVQLESLQDPTTPVEAILRRCNKQQMMLHYCITEYKDVNEFLSLLAVRLGRLKKGGVPDVTRAARTVLQHWNMGKINYYTHPPEKSESQVSSEIVTQMGKEFDMDSLLSDQQKIIDTLDKKSTKHMLVESMGPAKVVMNVEDVNKVTMETGDDDNEEEEDDDEEEEDDDEEMDEVESEEEEQSGEEMEGDEDEEMETVTVSLPKSAPRSRKNTDSSTTSSKTSTTASTKSSNLNPGLPQLNKAKKMDFKKMKKQRRRRDRVAGELSDALTSAFSMDNNDAGGDSYNFDEHF
ncbi:guanine nucleotide-binding protein-like 3 homolog [Ruditapes philippinarum]|uniref:guanine nucleotide-binding protein-like 3 homolog n=1 Tax=Ruditapes philippinarum TaxID=129788 RepID=UPI00295A8C33|nr:guanine nucleotide-binding protein-like 3 homolog [Ruditapes philippinarum]